MVKPSSETPDRHRIHNLSFFDQVSPPVYVPLLLFYRRKIPAADDDRAQLLKNSLSSALSKYYPLTVNCNDRGIPFLRWGKPVWVTTLVAGVENGILLIGYKWWRWDPAIVCLEEDKMAAFARDEKLLEFAQINPNPI